mgnify:CR=1 FL=1
MLKIVKADKDTYITDKVVMGKRQTDGNVGLAGTLDLFKLYGTSFSGSNPCLLYTSPSPRDATEDSLLRKIFLSAFTRFQHHLTKESGKTSHITQTRMQATGCHRLLTSLG